MNKAGTILLSKDYKKVGLVYRTKLDDYSFPKGHIEKDESLIECALRETEEETGRQERRGNSYCRKGRSERIGQEMAGTEAAERKHLCQLCCRQQSSAPAHRPRPAAKRHAQRRSAERLRKAQHRAYLTYQKKE